MCVYVYAHTCLHVRKNVYYNGRCISCVHMCANANAITCNIINHIYMWDCLGVSLMQYLPPLCDGHVADHFNDDADQYVHQCDGLEHQT